MIRLFDPKRFSTPLSMGSFFWFCPISFPRFGVGTRANGSACRRLGKGSIYWPYRCLYFTIFLPLVAITGDKLYGIILLPRNEAGVVTLFSKRPFGDCWSIVRIYSVYICGWIKPSLFTLFLTFSIKCIFFE